jgi:hypothetical protein
MYTKIKFLFTNRTIQDNVGWPYAVCPPSRKGGKELAGRREYANASGCMLRYRRERTYARPCKNKAVCE